MNDFGHLIRKSAVMTLRPGQVILHSGGLKHTVKQPHKYIIYESMDKPIYKSGYSKYAQLQRWKELFGNELKTPEIQTSFDDLDVKVSKDKEETLSLKPLETMNKQDYKKWVDYVASKSPGYLRKLKTKKENEMNWKKYLGLDKLQTYPIPHAPLMYSVQKPVKVRGRMLRALNEQTMLVGVQGFVCHLDRDSIAPGYPELTKIMNFGGRLVADREKEYDFYVLHAYHDKNGNPVIKLTMKEQGVWDKRREMERFSQSSFLSGLSITTQPSKANQNAASLDGLLNSLAKEHKKK